jgi:hypothetical protein
MWRLLASESSSDLRSLDWAVWIFPLSLSSVVKAISIGYSDSLPTTTYACLEMQFLMDFLIFNFLASETKGGY